MNETLIPAALALSTLLCLACSKTPVSPIGGNVGSETHWLTACSVDADCETAAGAACLCGLCTVTCADDAACDAATGLSSACVAAQDAALVRACGGAAPAQPVCVATCESDANCADGTACDTGRCLPSDEAGRVDGGTLPAPRSQTLTVPGRPKMDVLVVVDNSGSMCEEQGVLAAALRGASPGLADLDLRFAVVSTDLRTETDRGAFLVRPTTPEMSLTCPTAGGPNAPDTEACDAALAAVDLRDGVLRAENGASAEALATATSCLVTLGTLGDGFEKGLEAMRLALSCEGPQGGLFGECCREGVFDPSCVANPAFLRPDAGLLVVVLSDEADCSDPSVNPRASRRAICKYGPMDGEDADTLPDGYADPDLCPEGDPAVCFARECGALNADDCYRARCIVDRGDNENCLWHPEALTPVADYVDFLRSLKPRGGLDVRVLPLVGPTGNLPTGEPLTWTEGQPAAGCDPTLPDFDPQADAAMCCPNGACTGPSFAVCASESGRAYSGARYRELGQAFCEDAEDCAALDAVAICDDGFELGASIDRLLARVQRLFCLEVRPSAGESIEVSRDGTVLPAADYRLEDAPDCATGRALRLLDPVLGASYVVRVLP